MPGYRISWLRDEFAPFLAMAQMIYQTGTPVCSAPSAHNLRAVSTLFLPVKEWADHLAVGLEDDPPVDAALILCFLRHRHPGCAWARPPAPAMQVFFCCCIYPGTMVYI